jgi:ribosomal-protein-alanine N-acetyltransferase
MPPRKKTVEKKPERPVHIRWMIRRDGPAVFAIDQASFAKPWIEIDFLRALRQRNTIAMVAETGDTVVGFMIYELAKEWLELQRLVVATGFRREKIGSQMVGKLLGKLSSHRRRSLLVAIAESNLDAQLFFRSLGLRATRMLRGHYEDEDGIEMEYTLAGEEQVGEKTPVNRLAGYFEGRS